MICRPCRCNPIRVWLTRSPGRDSDSEALSLAPPGLDSPCEDGQSGGGLASAGVPRFSRARRRVRTAGISRGRGTIATRPPAASPPSSAAAGGCSRPYRAAWGRRGRAAVHTRGPCRRSGRRRPDGRGGPGACASGACFPVEAVRVLVVAATPSAGGPERLARVLRVRHRPPPTSPTRRAGRKFRPRRACPG